MALPAPKPDIDTCNACGKLFPRVRLKLCSQCALSPENRFDIVRQFLVENHGAAIPVIAEATGVSHGDVRKFLDGGRLVEVAGGANGACTCTPGAPRCMSCRNRLASKLRSLGDEMAEQIADEDLPSVRGRSGGGLGGGGRSQKAPDASDGRTSYVRRIRRIQGD